MGDEVPIAAACSMDKHTKEHMITRVHSLGLWFQKTIQEWVTAHDIKKLDVMIETPILRKTMQASTRNCPVCKKPWSAGDLGVSTLMKQMHLHAAYVEALYGIEGCKVSVGEVNNQTAKSVFTGNGKATKTLMVSRSAWANRPDVREREHLADAQAIGSCYPVMVPVYGDYILPKHPTYVDNAIGQGTQWKGCI